MFIEIKLYVIKVNNQRWKHQMHAVVRVKNFMLHYTMLEGISDSL